MPRMKSRPDHSSRPAGGREALSVRELLPCRATDLSRWSRNAMTRLLGGALLVSALFAAPAVRAETACEKALNSPPLSEVHDYIVGKKDRQYIGGSFANLFNATLRDKNCKKHEIIEYVEEFSIKKEEYSHDGYNVLVYRYKSPYEWYFIHIISIILNYDRPILLRFDLDGNFIASNWSI